MNRITAAGLLVSVAVALGCGREPASPAAAPSAVSLLGVWQGTMTDDLVGTGAVSFTIESENAPLSHGHWTVVFPMASDRNAGTMSGLVVDSSVTFLFSPDVPMACASGPSETSLSARLSLAGDRLTGSWLA